MSRIILDFSSGNTCRNDKKIVKRMIDELKAVDTGKHEVIIKFQLFEHAGQNIPLLPDVFEYAYEYAEKLGYKTTASVFNLNSLKFLLDYDVPFVKIANNRALDYLIGEVPRRIPVYVSVGKKEDGYTLMENYQTGGVREFDRAIYCISKYPAEIGDYEKNFSAINLKHGVSDHTIGIDLFKKYQPRIWEKHFRLPDSIGLDSGPFAITPKELREIL